MIKKKFTMFYKEAYGDEPQEISGYDIYDAVERWAREYDEEEDPAIAEGACVTVEVVGGDGKRVALRVSGYYTAHYDASETGIK